MEEELIKIFELPAERDFKTSLAAKINEMIDRDFEGLLFLLYRFDVDENKLKRTIQNADDAGKAIAELIIERHLEKQRSKEQFKSSQNDIPEEDKW